MTQLKKKVPLKKIIFQTLGKSRSAKYLKGIDFVYADTVVVSRTADLYEEAIKKLLDGETELAINFIVFALDIERENKLFLHLCKTMLFSLSKFLDENNMDFYKQKYLPDLNQAKVKIREKIRGLGDIIIAKNTLLKELSLELDSTEQLSFFFQLIFNFFYRKKLIVKIDSLRSKLSEVMNDCEILKKDLDHIEKVARIEEYVIVLGLIVQVCAFPARFEWATQRS